jgi:quercetin dioxygenase-like cupin family protein
MGDALRGMPDDLCQCPHWGYVFKGQLKLRTQHGDEFYEAGQAYYMPPGHSPEALEDCELLDISPTAQWNEVIDHIKAQMPEMA